MKHFAQLVNLDETVVVLIHAIKAGIRSPEFCSGDMPISVLIASQHEHLGEPVAIASSLQSTCGICILFGRGRRRLTVGILAR